MDEEKVQLTSDRIGEEEGAFEVTPVLDLGIKDSDLVSLIKHYEKKHKTEVLDGGLNLRNKRKKNLEFLFGRQLDDKTIKTYEKKYLDNVVREIETLVKPLLLSRMPDLIVKPGNVDGSEKSKKTAENLTKIVEKKMKSNWMRKVLGLAFKHLPAYYIGVIKWRWDPLAGRNGDIVFEVIHPENIVVDYTATSANQKFMRVVVHYQEKPLEDWYDLFPEKKDIIEQEAIKMGKITPETKEESAKRISVKMAEVWFDWKEKEEDEIEGEKFVYKSGVCWKLNDEIIDKMKNPNWDYEGEEKMFLQGQPIRPEDMAALAMMGQSGAVETKTVYRNFFNKIRKPFIFLGYEQWGDSPYDKISRIEDNLLMQQNLDDRGMQITKMIDDARGKHVFSTLSGMTKDDVEMMDLNDPDQDIVIDGELNKVHGFIQPELPSGEMFADFDRTRNRMMAKSHISAPTRGEIQTSTATTNQIARESDFTVADDISEETINDAALQIAEVMLHMMKLRYTPDHYVSILGDDGNTTFLNTTFDDFEDGMEVDIFASGTDKLRAEREAKEDAQLGLIDPLSYYRDTGRPDPKGRAEKLYMFQSNPELYFKKFIQDQDLPQIAQQVQQVNQQQQAQINTAPQQPSPTDTTQIPTTPQGSPRNLVGRGMNALKSLIGR